MDLTSQNTALALRASASPLTTAQIDAALEACLELQHTATAVHNKCPFASLLLGPDNETILLTHFGLGSVRHAECELARLAASHYGFVCRLTRLKLSA